MVYIVNAILAFAANFARLHGNLCQVTYPIYNFKESTTKSSLKNENVVLQTIFDQYYKMWTLQFYYINLYK